MVKKIPIGSRNGQIRTQESDSCAHSSLTVSCSFEMSLLACTRSGYLALTVSFRWEGAALPSSLRLRLLDEPLVSVDDGGGWTVVSVDVAA